MRIALTGAQGTGKSTLLERLKQQENIRYEYEFIDEITRRMVKKGLKINESGDNTTQLLIINEHIKNTLYDKAIMDRSILDGIVYTKWLYDKGKISHWVLDYAYNAFRTYITRYDHIFYIKPEFELEDDGVRSASVEFRDDIFELFENMIKYHGVNVTILTGTVEERLEQINSIVKW